MVIFAASPVTFFSQPYVLAIQQTLISYAANDSSQPLAADAPRKVLGRGPERPLSSDCTF